MQRPKLLPSQPRAAAAQAPASESADSIEGARRDGSAAVFRAYKDVWKAARSRRRFLRAEVRRFTRRQRRRRLYWTISVASIVLLAAVSWIATHSPLFAVERVQVVGAAQLDAATVEAALENQIGTPVASVNQGAIAADLAPFRLIETYSVEARPPHDLVVRIVERTPVGVMQMGEEYSLIDAAGVVLSTSPTAPADEPLIEIDGGPEGAVFEAVGYVIRALPESIRDQVSTVTATTPNDVTLTLKTAGARIVWGNAEESTRKALNLEKILVTHPLGTASLYDVTSVGAVVVQ